MSKTMDNELELDNILDGIYTDYSDMGFDKTTKVEAKADLKALLARERLEAMKVGQYQAAEKLYGDVCNIYMFGGNPTSTKAKAMAEWSATHLLQHCEAFMNDNNAAYNAYLARPKEAEAPVTPKERKENV